MKSNALRIALLALVLAAPAFAGDPALPAAFMRAKGEFQKEQYAESLADFDALDEMTQKPGNEADRKMLEPIVAFYRGANLAALGRLPEAKNSFITYISLNPNASPDPKAFPKAVIDAFTAARRDIGPGLDTGLAAEFAAFQPGLGELVPVNEHWAETPVRYLLTADQKKQWGALTTDEARRAWVDAFWKAMEPNDSSRAMRAEFDRRVAFAERKFGAPRHPGALSDRAVAFALLGPPSYISSSPMKSGDDKLDSMRGGTVNSSGQRQPSGGVTLGNSALGFDTISGAQPGDGLQTDLQRGTRQVWYYRKGQLPASLRYSELKIAFLTREGYGDGILQRDPETLQALGQAADLMKSGSH